MELYYREEILWKHRSRVDWLVDGDKNIIKSLKNGNGDVIAEINELEEMTTQFYSELYTSHGVSNMQKVLDFVPVKVTVAMNTSLNAAYREEVKNALFQMFPSKFRDPVDFRLIFVISTGMCAVMRWLKKFSI